MAVESTAELSVVPSTSIRRGREKAVKAQGSGSRGSPAVLVQCRLPVGTAEESAKVTTYGKRCASAQSRDIPPSWQAAQGAESLRPAYPQPIQCADAG